MRFGRRFNRSIAHLLMAVLLYAQLATAAYACPEPLRPGTPVAMAEMPGCDGHMGTAAMDPTQPLLCQAHCQPDAQNLQPAPAVDLQTAPLLWAVLDWSAAAVQPPALQTLRPQSPSGAPSPGSPPLYLSLLVLRN